MTIPPFYIVAGILAAAMSHQFNRFMGFDWQSSQSYARIINIHHKHKRGRPKQRG